MSTKTEQPGRWALAREANIEAWTIRDSSASGLPVKVIIPIDPYGRWDAEKIARLIAAAPYLLAALEGVLPVFDNDGTQQYAKVYADRIDAARAAIAKARGER